MRLIKWSTIDDIRSILKNMRTNVDNEFQDWFKEAKQIANEVEVDINVPRYAHRQQHRANAPADTPLQYFKLNVGIPFLDHIDQEMSSRFCEENRPGRDLFLLVPSVVRKCTDLHSMNKKLQFWKDDIPIHLSLLNESKNGSVTRPYSNHKKTRLRCSRVTLLLMRTVFPTSRHC